MNTDVTVRDVMHPNYVGVNECDGVVETVELMLEEGVDGVLVLRGQDPVGVLTERDVLGLVADGSVEDATVGEAMTARVPTVPPDRGVDDAATVMDAEGVRGLLVADGDEPMGIVTEHDLFSAATMEAPAESELLLANGVDERGEPGRFSNQSICEECGALSRDLVDVSGHLLCPNCRDL